MSLTKISETPNIDANVTIREKNQKDGSITVEATVTLFKNKTDGPGADIVKKVNAFAVSTDIDEAQDKALVRAVKLLGL